MRLKETERMSQEEIPFLSNSIAGKEVHVAWLSISHSMIQMTTLGKDTGRFIYFKF